MLKKLAGRRHAGEPVPDATLAELRKVAHKIYAEAIPDLGPKGKELVDLGRRAEQVSARMIASARPRASRRSSWWAWPWSPAVVIAEVILRYTLGRSLIVTEELSRYGMIWVAFLGLGARAARGGPHRRRGRAAGWAPRGQRVVRVVAELLSLVFLLVLAVAGLQVLPGPARPADADPRA